MLTYSGDCATKHEFNKQKHLYKQHGSYFTIHELILKSSLQANVMSLLLEEVATHGSFRKNQD